MNALPLVIGALCVFALGYRFYYAFVAAKVAVLDDSRPTPAHRLYDGHNYYPTNKWVLFGHHFAAIAGAGPLIGPVLATQFGFMPGFLWILIGAVLAGGVHDFIILFASVRRDGKSLAEIARNEISPVSGLTASIAILLIIIIALSGLGLAVVNSLKESSWGTFTIACTIPIALFVGWYMFRFRKGKIGEGTVIGVLLVIAAVIVGKYIPGSALAPYFTFDHKEITILMAIYGFFASVLPVWLLLSPRDYLSSWMKIGVVAFLTIGVVIVAPDLKMPAFTQFVHGGGPVIPGKVFPFVFITIACGAISGWHSLVGSGTTPKMILMESHIKVVSVGAMLVEGFVSVLALIASSSLFPLDYFVINVPIDKMKEFASELSAMGFTTSNLPQLAAEVGESLAGRTGGAVSLAVGMAQIFSNIPGMKNLMAYWYHFAIMFEALFILTTIDAGTRIARFVLQEFVGKIYKPFERTNWMPGTIISSLAVVLLWAYFIYTGSISQIWPMFGVSNQLLATIALCVGTSVIVNMGKWRYAWVTFVPMCFLAITTLIAGWLNIVDNFLPLARKPGFEFQGYLDALLTLIMMVCVVVIFLDASPRWYRRISLDKVGKLAPDGNG
jgi:carbon starvation protein